MTDRKELIEVLEHCMKDDCNGCPNHYTDGHVACDDYMYGMSASMPVTTIQDAVDLLKEQEGLEKKYTVLLNEKISELIEENAKLNLEMNQAIFERSIHTVDRR